MLKKMVEYYGARVDHPESYPAFQFVLDTGGADSPRLKDLRAFATVFVNPAKRNLKFDCYSAAAALPGARGQPAAARVAREGGALRGQRRLERLGRGVRRRFF